MSGMTASITRATRYEPNVALMRATLHPTSIGENSSPRGDPPDEAVEKAVAALRRDLGDRGGAQRRLDPRLRRRGRPPKGAVARVLRRSSPRRRLRPGLGVGKIHEIIRGQSPNSFSRT